MIKTAQDAYLTGRQAATIKLSFLEQYRRPPGERPSLGESAMFAGKVGLGAAALLGGTYGLAVGADKLVNKFPRAGGPALAAGALALAAARYSRRKGSDKK